MIYVFQSPKDFEKVKFISESLKNEGISRFGWSYSDGIDLTS